MKTSMKLIFFCTLAVTASGCLFAPRTELNSALSQNRALTEQSRAQLVEIETLKAHSRDVEDRLIRSQQRMALLEQEQGGPVRE